ncbi:MAG TPA: hypothetical protein VHY84_23975 [Bryobacteraceae bacterium]|jgi:hypothetical protein|nr:hypothetical protein [Bryobacteraceae bacterium]
MLALAILPVALRLALLARHPAPSPQIYDEFGHLLVADTLRHFRFANPPHALPQFFETFFVLQSPTYSSIYPVGQGLALLVGRILFGTPWAGVLLSTAAFCSLCYWMLRGWTTPSWALLGGLLAVFEFGPLNQWTNSYWGGGYSAVAGCLVFGALPRLRREYRTRDAALLGLGLGMHLLSRPFESIFLLLSVLLFLIPDFRNFQKLAKPALVMALVCLPALGIVLVQNKQVTGNWTTLPYSLSQYQYGVPASFTFQPHPVPHHDLTREQDLDYKMQRAFRAKDIDTTATYFQRLVYRIRYLRFFLYPALYPALIIFLACIRNYRSAWVALALLIFALGTNFYPLFLTHYVACVTCLFVLVSVEGLRLLNRLPSGQLPARVLVYLCAAQFVFLYGVYALDRDRTPDRRAEINRQLSEISKKTSGKLLVLVRYWPQHIFQDEWVYNAADIDSAPIVWARDLGDAEDQKLLHYYPNRTVLLLEPDARPPRLTPWHPEPSKPPDKPQQKTVPKIPFEPVVNR